MRFHADVESLTVLVGQEKYCRFADGIYETDDKDEIAALQRAKGVREIETVETKQKSDPPKIRSKSNKMQKKRNKR